MRDARVLLLRGGAIGDCVLTLPVLQALRERWPDSRLEIATYPRTGRLIKQSGLADEYRSLEEVDFARLFAYRGEQSEDFRRYIAGFDLVFNLLYDPDGLVPARLKEAGAKQVFSLDPHPYPTGIHAADHLATVLNPLAIYTSYAMPRLPWPKDRNPIAEILLHPGSGSPAKNWSIDRYLSLARLLTDSGRPVRFLTGEAEADLLPKLEASGLSLVREAPLPLLCEILACARLYIGNDSGITHLAAALGLPVIALFGPTDPQVWGPRGSEVVLTLRAPGGDLAQLKLDRVLEALQGVLV